MEVPDPHLAAQAAAGNDAGVGGMELDAPGGAGVALQGLQAAPGLHLRDVDVVVAVRGGHHRAVRREHHQKGGSDEIERGDNIFSPLLRFEEVRRQKYQNVRPEKNTKYRVIKSLYDLISI